MRLRQLGAAIVVTVAAVSGVLASLGGATAAWNNPVTFTDRGCSVGYRTVSHSHGTVVFGVFNLGSVSHRFFLGGRYATQWIQPQQEQTLVTNLRPGRYKWACVAFHKTIGRGLFTIGP